MSHLEENSSFDDEYWDMVHGAQPLPLLPVFLGEGPNRAPGQAFRNPFTTAPPSLPPRVQPMGVQYFAEQKTNKPQTKTVINYTVEKARLYWGGGGSPEAGAALKNRG